MGVRLKSEFTNFYGDDITIEVIDNSYGGGVIDFTTDREKVNLAFNGSLKDRGRVINTTELEFPLLVENEDHLNFWDDMNLQQEGRFYVKMYVTHEGDSGLRYVGHLVMDESFLQNKGGGQFIDLKAADGLYRLADQEYKSDSDDQTNAYGNNIAYYEGFDNFKNIIFKCLNGLGVQDLYSASDEFVWINQNWYESNMSSLSGVSSFEWVRVNQRVFTSKNEEEEYTTMSRADVLKEVLKPFNCRISYVWGKYIIESINERGDDGRTFRRYDKGGNHLGNSTVSNTYVLDNGVERRILGGGKFGKLPPIKQGCVTLSFTLGNYGYTPNYWSDTESTLISLGDIQVTSEETAIFVGVGLRFVTQPTFTLPSSAFNITAFVYFGLTIKFGSYYYITEHTTETYTYYEDDGTPVTESRDVFENKWSTTAGTYLLVSDKMQLDTMQIFGQRRIKEEFVTLPLREILDPDPTPAYNIDDVDSLSVKIEHIKIASIYDYSETWDTHFNVVWETQGFYLTPTEGTETVDKTDSAVKYCYENNINNSYKVETSIMLGDTAFNTNNRVEVYDGTDWVASGQSWAISSITSGGKPLQNLLLEELVRGQTKTVGRYIGAFEGMPDPSYLIEYDGITWVPTQFTYNLGFRRWTGEWYEYNYDALPSFEVTSSGTQVETGSGTTASGGNPATPSISSIAWPISVDGADSATIDMTGFPLPDPTAVSQGQINTTVQIYRGGVRLWYGTASDMNHFTISGTDIILGRALRTGETLKGVLYELIS